MRSFTEWTFSRQQERICLDVAVQLIFKHTSAYQLKCVKHVANVAVMNVHVLSLESALDHDTVHHRNCESVCMLAASRWHVGHAGDLHWLVEVEVEGVLDPQVKRSADPESQQAEVLQDSMHDVP